MDDLRGWWEVPSIAHFCSLFRNAFDLTDFDIEDLEEALLDSETESGSDFILELLCKLLNGCYCRKDISAANYDLYVKDVIKYKWEGVDSPVHQKSTFRELTLREKVELIHAICEYRLDAEDVVELLKGFDGDNMRVEPLGKDKDGGTYWYFYGSRMYKEDPPPKQELTKEEKRALERKKRQEAKKKKEEEKRKKKQEKQKLKVLKKQGKRKVIAEKVKKEQQKASANIRRSGRIKLKKIEQEDESDSSESSSSSSTEVESEASSSEEEEEEEETEPEEVEVKKGGKKKTATRARDKTPVKKGKQQQQNKAVSKSTSKKQPARSKRGAATPKNQKTPEVKAPKTDPGIRRSSRIRCKKTDKPPPPPKFDSDTEEEEDDDEVDDHDSGHESGDSDDDKSVKSEVSKYSTNSSANKRPSGSRKVPMSRLNLNKEFNQVAEDGGKLDDSEDQLDAVNGDISQEEKEARKESPVDEVESEQKPVEDESMEVDDDKTEAPAKSTDDTEIETSEQPKPTEQCNDKETMEKTNEQTSENQDTADKIEINQKCESEVDDKLKEIKKEEDESKPASPEIKTENVLESTSNNAQVDGSKDEMEDKIEEEAMETDVDKPEGSTENNTKDNDEVEEKASTSEQLETLGDRKVAVKTEESDEKTDIKSIIPALTRPAVPPKKSDTQTRWHLICSTLDDWVNLAEWFKDSTVRCEKSLSKLLTEDFLPVLPEIIEARERERKKRLQELEVRRSDRITFKQREKMEQERILAEALADEERARLKAEEERKLKDEQNRLEEENRLREERFRAREERANRLSMREERARLIAEGREIPPELIYTGTQKYKDDEDSDDSRCDLKDEEDYQNLMKVINALKLHKDCWPFLEPVTEEQAPGYSDVIKRPMDMTKIESKVEKREYRSSAHFLSDFRLMFNNCKRFNGPDSEFTECARAMELMLKKYRKRFMSDEPVDQYYADRDFTVSGVRGSSSAEKRYRPKRAASSRALQTVQKALGSDEEDSSEEDEEPRPKKHREFPAKTLTHQSHLLQEMIEMKRQREKRLAASALENHGVITRGPERVRVQNPSGGVMIIPKEELPPTGVLRLAATREIKRKVNPEVLRKPEIKNYPGLSVIDSRKPGAKPPKTIRIVAASPTLSGSASVKETAESVKVSHDGYLIIGGKNSGIKVSENTKIVIQPPGTQPGAAAANSPNAAMAKEIFIKKLPSSSSASPAPVSSTQPQTSHPVVHSLGPVTEQRTPTQQESAPFRAQAIITTSSNINIQPQPPLVSQTATAQIISKALTSSGVVNQNTPEFQKKQMDIAQRIMMLNQQKRQIMQQKQSQQNGQMAEGAAKVMRLDPSAGASPGPAQGPSHQSIEDRLRDPAIDNQLGAVAKNVVSSVNIASDILDSYYSVMNKETKEEPVPQQQLPSVIQSHLLASPGRNVSESVSHGLRTKLLSQQQTVRFVEASPDVIPNGPSNVPHVVPQSVTTRVIAPNVSAAVRAGNVNVAGLNNVIPKVPISPGQTGVTRPAFTATGPISQSQNSVNRPAFSAPVAISPSQTVVNRPAFSAPVLISPSQTVVNRPAFSAPVSISPSQAVVNRPAFSAPVPISPSQSSVNRPVFSAPQPVVSSPIGTSSLNTSVSTVYNQDGHVSIQTVLNSTRNLTGGKVQINLPQVVPHTAATISLTNITLPPQTVNTVSPVSLPGHTPHLPSFNAAVSQQITTDNNMYSPIEALFADNTSSQPVTAQHVTAQPLTAQHVTVPMQPQNNSTIQISSADLASIDIDMSPSKSNRTNLFDMFEGNQSVLAQASNTGAANFVNVPGISGIVQDNTNSSVNMTGVQNQSQAALNFGSPLRTMSIMEALKSKLNPAKVGQSQETPATPATVSQPGIPKRDLTVDFNSKELEDNPSCTHIDTVDSTADVPAHKLDSILVASTLASNPDITLAQIDVVTDNSSTANTCSEFDSEQHADIAGETVSVYCNDPGTNAVVKHRPTGSVRMTEETQQTDEEEDTEDMVEDDDSQSDVVVEITDTLDYDSDDDFRPLELGHNVVKTSTGIINASPATEKRKTASSVTIRPAFAKSSSCIDLYHQESESNKQSEEKAVPRPSRRLQNGSHLAETLQRQTNEGSKQDAQDFQFVESWTELQKLTGSPTVSEHVSENDPNKNQRIYFKLSDTVPVSSLSSVIHRRRYKRIRRSADDDYPEPPFRGNVGQVPNIRIVGNTGNNAGFKSITYSNSDTTCSQKPRKPRRSKNMNDGKVVQLAKEHSLQNFTQYLIKNENRRTDTKEVNVPHQDMNADEQLVRYLGGNSESMGDTSVPNQPYSTCNLRVVFTPSGKADQAEEKPEETKAKASVPDILSAPEILPRNLWELGSMRLNQKVRRLSAKPAYKLPSLQKNPEAAEPHIDHTEVKKDPRSFTIRAAKSDVSLLRQRQHRRLPCPYGDHHQYSDMQHDIEDTGFLNDEVFQNELDNSLNCDADFFTSDLRILNLFPPHLGDGDDIDQDLENIKDDIFELQEQYLGHSQTGFPAQDSIAEKGINLHTNSSNTALPGHCPRDGSVTAVTADSDRSLLGILDAGSSLQNILIAKDCDVRLEAGSSEPQQRNDNG